VPSGRRVASWRACARIDGGAGDRLKPLVVSSHLFIVSRREPELFAYLSKEFQAEPDVRVIVDRRVGERRRSAEHTPAVERRRRDRRGQSHVSRQVNSIGYAFVRVDD
jgi:hypothetical protein